MASSTLLMPRWAAPIHQQTTIALLLKIVALVRNRLAGWSRLSQTLRIAGLLSAQGRRIELRDARQI
jgi:hypothetical protein